MDGWLSGWMDGWMDRDLILWFELPALCALLPLLSSSSSASERASERWRGECWSPSMWMAHSCKVRGREVIVSTEELSPRHSSKYSVWRVVLTWSRWVPLLGFFGILFLCLISFVFLRWTSWCCSFFCIGSSWFMLRGEFCIPKRVNLPRCGYTRGLGLGSGLVTSMWQLSTQTKLQNWLGL